MMSPCKTCVAPETWKLPPSSRSPRILLYWTRRYIDHHASNSDSLSASPNQKITNETPHPARADSAGRFLSRPSGQVTVTWSRGSPGNREAQTGLSGQRPRQRWRLRLSRWSSVHVERWCILQLFRAGMVCCDGSRNCSAGVTTGRARPGPSRPADRPTWGSSYRQRSLWIHSTKKCVVHVTVVPCNTHSQKNFTHLVTIIYVSII